MKPQERLPLVEVEQRVCDIASAQLGIKREVISPASRVVDDLGCDSLDLVELFIELEETFGVVLPNDAPNPAYKAVFTRQPFRLADLAEMIYLQQGTGKAGHNHWRGRKVQPPPMPSVPFTQLGGTWQKNSDNVLLESLTKNGVAPQFRRRSDGMRCVMIPATSVELGSDESGALPDERPPHVVRMDAFLIDAEPVSTTAYCRFLNSIGPVSPGILADWFLLDAEDDRNEHVLIEQAGQQWRPVPASERWPMILVSWFGANAYSLWANGKDWSTYRAEGFLPSEAQWEYAARGARSQPFPWGAEPPLSDRLCCAQHRRSATYRADSLPMADVNHQLGMSPFDLHHMAGNVWQWCQDWYAEDFYQRAEANEPNPINRTPGMVRSERGGSWVGRAELCRSSYRRGRPPVARGRCLGFRCISPINGIA
jgi:acyl carrier protein